jgi:hypothetical protein
LGFFSFNEIASLTPALAAVNFTLIDGWQTLDAFGLSNVGGPPVIAVSVAASTYAFVSPEPPANEPEPPLVMISNPAPWLSISCEGVLVVVVAAIFAVVELVHEMIDVNVLDPGVERPEQVASLVPALIEIDEIFAPVMPVLLVPSVAVPVQAAMVFEVVVTGTDPAEYTVSGMDATAAFTVAFAFGSLVCADCTQSLASGGLTLTLPVIVQFTLLPEPAVMMTVAPEDAPVATNPALPSAMTAVAAPNHLSFFT